MEFHQPLCSEIQGKQSTGVLRFRANACLTISALNRVPCIEWVYSDRMIPSTLNANQQKWTSETPLQSSLWRGVRQAKTRDTINFSSYRHSIVLAGTG